MKKIPLFKKEHRKPGKAVKIEIANIIWPEKVKKQSSSPVKTKKRPSKGQGQIVGKFTCDVQFYITQMKKKGAKLILYERRNGKLYELLGQKNLIPINRMNKSYSQTSRRITDDYPDALKIINDAEKLYGPGRYEIILLIPDALEKELKNNLTQIAIKKNKINLNQVSTFFISYKNQNSQLAIKLEKVLVGDHKFDINQTFIF